jgi:hypothetical protein
MDWKSSLFGRGNISGAGWVAVAITLKNIAETKDRITKLPDRSTLACGSDKRGSPVFRNTTGTKECGMKWMFEQAADNAGREMVSPPSVHLVELD